MTSRGPLLLVLTLLGCASHVAPPAPAEGDFEDAGSDEPSAEAGATEERAPGLARNVIVFMGDGMGPEQLSTARYAKQELRIDQLQGPAFANTDSLTTMDASDPELAPTDSAAAATVIATGQRVANDVLSITPDGEPLETVLEVCKRAGKATGLITTSYFFDASPAAFAVHQGSRSFSDAIVLQMLSETQPDVIMGNGGWLFDDPAHGLHAVADAYDYWLVHGLDELLSWDVSEHPRMIGLFATDFLPLVSASEDYTMTPALERRADSPDPTLATMTERALDRLGSDPDGFFLFAEDELLDEMGHRGPAEVEWVNRAYPAQTAALDDAVGVAIDWVERHSSFDETLIVLLADHETGGYHYDHALGPVTGSFSAFSAGEAYPIGNHTRTKTAVYALGPGSARVSAIRQHADTHRLLLGELE